ncbi:hypothetical protein QDR37_06100 [Amnibacterium sp. CER49]|uniref:MFS transporter n=1 Tax=Amnibacterium sp. CER49 TaxID=3039161 RepID=UPI002447E1C6|nr:MFS transporter [Amnibacterium sp. CER49]MDH2443512.1 hypothetical protein [Amnibacterium sp. CER49]
MVSDEAAVARGVRDERSGGRPSATRDIGLVLASATVDSFGSGLWLAGGALFFHRAVGLPLPLIGLGLAFAGLVALPAGVRLARLADRHGARGFYLALTMTQAACYVVFVFVHSFLLFVLLATIAASADSAAQAIRSALVRAIGGATAVRFRARLHALMNVAIALGAALAAVLIGIGSLGAYDVLIVLDAVTFALAGVLVARTTLQRVAVAPAGRRWVAIRDRAYVAAATLDGVLDLEFGVSGFVLPLWVVTRTSAPHWLAALLLLLNTVLVATLQVRFSRGSDTVRGAARSFRRAALTLAAAAIVFSSTGGVPPAGAVLMLVLAMTVLSFGELQHAPGQFGLAYGMAPEHAAAEYQAVFSLGMGLSRAFAPAILTFLCVTLGAPGWWLLALLFLAAGLLMPLVAQRSAAGAGVGGAQ